MENNMETTWKLGFVWRGFIIVRNGGVEKNSETTVWGLVSRMEKEWKNHVLVDTGYHYKVAFFHSLLNIGKQLYCFMLGFYVGSSTSELRHSRQTTSKLS